MLDIQQIFQERLAQSVAIWSKINFISSIIPFGHFDHIYQLFTLGLVEYVRTRANWDDFLNISFQIVLSLTPFQQITQGLSKTSIFLHILLKFKYAYFMPFQQVFKPFFVGLLNFLNHNIPIMFYIFYYIRNFHFELALFWLLFIFWLTSLFFGRCNCPHSLILLKYLFCNVDLVPIALKNIQQSLYLFVFFLYFCLLLSFQFNSQFLNYFFMIFLQ